MLENEWVHGFIQDRVGRELNDVNKILVMFDNVEHI
jgi:hypothetical protein